MFYVGGDVLYDVLDVPVTFKGCAAPAGTAPADLSSYNMGFGFRTGAFSFFYTGGANAAFISESSFGRGAFTLANLFVGHYYNVAAPAIGAGRFTLVKDGVSSIGVDYIAGVGVDLDWLDATVGFVGSTGAYVTVDQLDLKLFGRSLIQKLGQDTLELTYLKAGKEAFDWWNEGGAQGETAVYARKLRLPLPDSGDLRDAAYELALEQLDLWTAPWRSGGRCAAGAKRRRSPCPSSQEQAKASQEEIRNMEAPALKHALTETRRRAVPPGR